MNTTFALPFVAKLARVFVLGATVALSAVTATSSAALIITSNEDAPTENIYKSNLYSAGTSSNINFYWRGIPAADQIKTAGQGLSTAGAATPLSLSAVTFQVHGFSPEVVGMTLALSIYEANAVNTLPSPSTLLTTLTGTLPELGAKEYLTLAFDTPITLQPDKHYAFICSFTGPTSSDNSVKHLGFVTSGSGNNTDNSRRWIGTDGVQSGQVSNGFIFYAHASPIPEPGVALLVSGALVGLGICRRLRNS